MPKRKKRRQKKKRHSVAKALAEPKFRLRIVPDKRRKKSSEFEERIAELERTTKYLRDEIKYIHRDMVRC